jgi:hypothetical protein
MENLQNQDQQNNFNQPAQQNPKKQISTLVGIIIIIAAAVILFGGVFVYQYLVIQKVSNQPQVQSQTAKYSASIETINGSNIITTKIHVKNLLTNEDKVVKIETCCIEGGGCGLCPMPCQIKGFSPTQEYIVEDCGTSPVRTVNVINIASGKEVTFSAGSYSWLNNEEIALFEVGDKARESDESAGNQCKINVVSGVKECTSPTVSQAITLTVWPEVNSFDLTNQTFKAKDLNVLSTVKILTNSSTKYYRQVSSNEYHDFQWLYNTMKNWEGPAWHFTARGIMQPDGSVLASEIYYTVQ